MRHQIAYSSPITQVDTTRVYPLGDVREEYNSTYNQWQLWTYVFNDEAATAFAQGDIVAHDTTTATPGDAILAPLSCPTTRVIGVAQHAIAAGSYGWVLSRGIGEVLADTGGITADTNLVVGNAVAGRADDAAATAHGFAYSHEAALATALATCSIKCI